MGGATLMYQLTCCGDDAAANRLQVVHIQFQANGILAFWADQQGRTNAAECLRKGGRGPTMQQTHGLYGTPVHWKRGAQVPRFVGQEPDSQVRDQRLLGEAIGLLGVLGREAHGPKVDPDICPMAGERILLVEDEASLRNTLRLNLEMEGYAVSIATTGPEALDRLRGAHFDLAIMDVMLPGIDGFTVIETVRLEGNRVPALFLTARNTATDRIRGLRAGDDHLGKPFDLTELLLRISKLVRRMDQKVAALVPSSFSFPGGRIDFDRFEAIGPDGVKHDLTQRESLLLRLLVEKAGEVVSREEILRKVWGYNVFPTTRTVDNFIVAFRKYFEPDPREPRHFHSIRGVGYKFTP